MTFIVKAPGKTDSLDFYLWPTATTFPIPAKPAFAGLVFYLQFGSFDLANKAFPLVFTDAHTITINYKPGSGSMPLTRNSHHEINP